MQILYLLPWFVFLVLMLFGTIVSMHSFEHLSHRKHAPKMFDTGLPIWSFLRKIQEEKLLFEETMSAQEPL